MNHLLVGLWLYTHILYHGTVSSRPNPNLQMTLDFQTSEYNTLQYFYKGESGLCKRQATFQYDGKILNQYVTEADPNNSAFCDNDPDMKKGSATRNPAYIKNGQLYLELEIGDESITYIWSKI